MVRKMFRLDVFRQAVSIQWNRFTEYIKSIGDLPFSEKTNEDYSTVSSQNHPDLLNLSNSDHIAKKQKLSPSKSQIHYQLTSSNSAVLRGSPKSKQREVHAPYKHKRFGFSVNSKKCFSKENEMGNAMRGKRGKLKSVYNSVSELVSNPFRPDKEEVVEVRDESKREVDGLLEKRKDTVVIDSDDEWVIVEDVTEGWIVVPEGKCEESDGDMEILGVNLERNFQPSSSSLVTDTNNGNLNVDHTTEMLDKLSLSRESMIPVVPFYNESLQQSDVRLQEIKFQIYLKENERETQKLLRPQKKGEDVKKDVVAEAFTPHTKEERDEIKRALSNSSRNKVLVTHEKSGIDITGELLQCLKPGEWLNDEVINVYLELLKEREKREPQKFLKCHFFNTFFYKKLFSGEGVYNFQSVKRWTSQKKLGYCLLDCDKIFVPIHQKAHWCLAVVNKKDEKFQYLDSLGGVDTQVMQVLARYYVDEVKDKTGKEVDVSSWREEFVKDLPKQKNGFDCGVFMIKYADFYSRGVGLCFDQRHMRYFRERTVTEILRLNAD